MMQHGTVSFLMGGWLSLVMIFVGAACTEKANDHPIMQGSSSQDSMRTPTASPNKEPAFAKRMTAGADGGTPTRVVTQTEAVAVNSGAPVHTSRPTVEMPAHITSACGGCHAVPRPEEFTDRTWPGAIRYMYWLFDEFYPQPSGYLTQAAALDFYLKNAAQRLPTPRLYPVDDKADRRFTFQPFQGPRSPTLIGDLSVVQNQQGQRVLLTTDMLAGRIEETPLMLNAQPRVVTTAEHPTATRRYDIDGDGRLDDVVIELRTFSAKDIQRGRMQVVFNRKSGAETRAILEGVGRIADVAVAEVDAHAGPQFVVADFGWQKTGGLHVLTRRETAQGDVTFDRKTVDTRAGHIAVAIADMDGDGDQDLVGGLAQHHEQIDVWINEGKGRYTRKTLFKAHTPMWGLMTLKVADLDNDGDMDIVHVNGDTLDAPKIAAFQGVHLLENRGQGRFETRQIAELPGAHDLDIGDIDGDGRLDIVAVANLAPGLTETLWHAKGKPDANVPMESVIVLRQTQPLRFQVRSLLRQQSCFSAVALADLDSDGDLDIALGSFGIGWTLLSSYEPESVPKPAKRACDQDQLWWLSNDASGRRRNPPIAKAALST
ncbi:MAG: VCBS repeat-containing protein [Myxococcota bacterium]|nr:VCBS repeat-containing protein [Myxococcota bacterium]